MTECTPDKSEILKALSVLAMPPQMVELRALGYFPKRYRTPCTVTGYFDDIDLLAEEAGTISPSATGVYITLNRINSALMARAANRVVTVAPKMASTADADVCGRVWLPIDLDPKRPSGISSTDEEHLLALARAEEIREALRRDGWPDPLVGDSGNGAHLLYRIDLPSNDGGLVRRCLQALALHFDDGRVAVDTNNFNPARIWKLYGTLSRKGDHTPERPHRLSRLIEVPHEVVTVSAEQMQKLTQIVPVEEPKLRKSTTRRTAKTAFDLAQWIAEHGLEAEGPTDWNGGRRWILPCPWNPAHGKSAFIVQLPSGAVAARCHHNSCAGKDWLELRRLVGPESHMGTVSTGEARFTDETAAANQSVQRLSEFVFDPEREAPPEVIYFDGFCGKGDVVLWLGREKHRKTNVILQLSMCATIGRSFLGFAFKAPAPLRVVIVDWETKTNSLHGRYNALRTAMKLTDGEERLLRQNLQIIQVRELIRHGGEFRRFPLADRKTDADELAAREAFWLGFADAYPADLYVFDPMRSMHSADENDSAIEGLFSRLRQFFPESAIIVAHHMRKQFQGGKEIRLQADMRTWSDGARGSGALKAHADEIVCQERTTDEHGAEILHLGCFLKDGADVEPMKLEESDNRSFYWVVSRDVPSELQKPVQVLEKAGGRFTGKQAMAEELMTSTGISRATAYRRIEALERLGFLAGETGVWVLKAATTPISMEPDAFQKPSTRKPAA